MNLHIRTSISVSSLVIALLIYSFGQSVWIRAVARFREIYCSFVIEGCEKIGRVKIKA